MTCEWVLQSMAGVFEGLPSANHHLLLIILTWSFGSVFAWNHIENILQKHPTLAGSHCAAIELLVASSSMSS
jgi:hypothetical protein